MGQLVTMSELGLKPFSLKFSQQLPHERNCGQHCVSMVTKLPIEVICEEINKYKGTYHSDITWVLRRFGYDCDVVRRPFISIPLLPELALLDVTCPAKWDANGKITRRGKHFALHFRGEYWCSCQGIHKLTPSFLRESRLRIKGYYNIEIS